MRYFIRMRENQVSGTNIIFFMKVQLPIQDLCKLILDITTSELKV